MFDVYLLIDENGDYVVAKDTDGQACREGDRRGKPAEDGGAGVLGAG